MFAADVGNSLLQFDKHCTLYFPFDRTEVETV